MAHDIYVRTNQKIYFAGLALAAWKRAEEQPTADSLAQIHASREAALFHLYGGALSLCHEVGGYYHLACASAARLEDCLNNEVLAAEPSAELGELHELLRHSETWLAQLNSAYQALFEPPRAPRKAKVDPGLALIHATQLEEGPEPLSRENLESWRQQLKQLALRLREGMSEY
jgi:hypothetical protein